ncbi:DUF4132 domain-containing protein [Janthinobacterium sp. RB2R34]|uniref:DUF4132 domain-containing protein n=1 Tax=Janthinobacterium sp. RB2R34 TaxID=3424193 RepID=UPI003F237DC1
MFKNILAAAKQAVGLDDYDQLKKGLRGLTQISKPVWESACAFVCEGGDPQVLLELQKDAPRAGKLLGRPGRLVSGFYTYNMDKKDAALASESLRHRHQFYAQFDAEKIDTDVLVRLGKLLQAADQGDSLDRGGAPVPDWLHYVVNDALHASFDSMRFTATVVNRRGWHVGQLVRLLSAEGEPEIAALQMVFERSGLSDYERDRAFPSLLVPGALDEYMLAHAALVEQLPALLSASGKVQLARRLGGAPALADAFAAILVRLAVDGGKTVRVEAAPHLAAIPEQRRVDLLQQLLVSGKTEERVQAAELLGRGMRPEQSALLEQALASETSKPVQAAIRNALSWLGAASDAGAGELPEVPLPPAPPATRLGDDALQLLRDNHAAMLAKYRIDAQKEREENQQGKHKYKWQQDALKRYEALKDDYLVGAIRVLNGEGGKGDDQPVKNNLVSNVVEFQGKLAALPQFGMVQMARWMIATRRNSLRFWHDGFFQQWLARQDLQAFDLRLLDRAMREAGDQSDSVAMVCLASSWWGGKPQQMLDAALVWPLFAERRELIDQGLGLRAVEKRQGAAVPELGATLEILAMFPTLPVQWLPRVMEFALGEGKQHRAAAQQVLAGLPDIGKRVAEALASGKQDMRIGAARWLTDLDYRAAVPALYQALDKESRETVIAALLTALEKLGEDLGPRLSPEVLLTAARKGLKGKAPVGLAWFSFEALPACHWKDGSAVEPDIIRWWVVLACKLKEPGGNGLLLRYLSLLDDASRAVLGETILRQFIAQDTRGPSMEVATAHAEAHAPARYQSYQDSAKRYPQYYTEQGKLTPEQVFDEVRREKLAEYLGSAIGEKGILALAAYTPGHLAVTLLQGYIRDHYPRRAQIEAMLDGLADGYDPAVIQLLLGIARRYRTASVQEKARLLVERIAQGKGWSQDQLGDRTIPTGGFDDNGRLDLPYGERVFYVTLDGAMKPVLHNPDGKEIKALPEPRQDEAPEAAKEAKQQLSVCKKELKQVITMQTARLYEAMCAGRVWPANEWSEYLLRHPIAGRLVQSLVWISEGEGGQTLLRPSDDGSLLDVNDDEVALDDHATLRLAHASLLDAGQITAWQRHFKDYKVKPLFDQLAHQLPDASLMTGREIADREGWVGDTFGLRGAFGKRGYLRGQAEDGGVFTEYHKDFPSAGLRAQIDFSGSGLPEEQMAAAVKTLAFYRLPQSWRDEAVLLLDVPPVLLAEAYADYHAVASSTGGYDAQWESKMPW